MSVKVEKQENNLVKLTIEIPVEKVEAAIDRVYARQKGKIAIPGFRKGKAPRKVVEQYYGDSIFMEDAINDVVPTVYEEAYEENKDLNIVSSPELDFVQTEKGKPVIFTALVATRPPVTLGQYKELEVDVPAPEVTEEDIEAELKKEQEKNAVLKTVEDRPVQDGDDIHLDFEGFVDGKPFDGGKGEDYLLTVGTNTFIPGFEEQLIGMSLDEEKDVQVTFPEDYHAKELAGKPATFLCRIKSIQEHELPELNDEFASDVSEFETLDEYKEDIRKKLMEAKEAEAKKAKENALLDKAVENAGLEIPDLMLKTEQRGMVEDFTRQMQNSGVTMEQYLKFTGQTEEGLMEQTKEAAEKRIRGRLVLEEIAKAEDIQVTDEDIEAEFDKMAEQYNMEKEKIKSFTGEEQIEVMRDQLKTQKALDLLFETAK